MFRLLSKSWRLVIIPLVASAVVAGYYFYFNSGTYTPPEPAELRFEGIILPSYAASTYTESPVTRRGLMVVDIAHNNRFTEDELNTLVSRVINRGYTIDFLGEEEEQDALPRSGKRMVLLKEKLRGANSLLVALPQNEYTDEEADVVEGFVSKGGKVLLIADPSRSHRINSLAERFGMIFDDDFLYNVAEHDVNYQNIFIEDFLDDELTEGLSRIVLHTASSIKSYERGLGFTDQNTLSSTVQSTDPFATLVKSQGGLVVGISDMTFMTAPQDSLWDNSRLIANIADFLTTSEREFHLTDFPHFLGQSVKVVMGDSRMLHLASRLRAGLETPQREVRLANSEDLSQDMIFLGSFEDIAQVEHYLLADGIRIEDSITTPFTTSRARTGSATISLHEDRGRHVLLILADSVSDVEETLRRLQSGEFRDGLVSDNVAVFQIFQAD